jgi:hypothetical protein
LRKIEEEGRECGNVVGDFKTEKEKGWWWW